MRMWREQAIIEWLRQVIYIVASCHSVKLCAHAAWVFQSQQNGAVTRMWRLCRVQSSHKRTCNQCGSLKKGGDVVATFPLVLHWMYSSPQTECAQRTTSYLWRGQATIECSCRVNSLIACCRSAELCAHAAHVFRSQQCDCYLTGTWSAWSWCWLVITPSPLPPPLTIRVGCDASMVSTSNWEPHCLQHTAPWSLDRYSTQRSPVHQVGIHSISNRDTHLCHLHNYSSAYLTKITNAINCLLTIVGRFRCCWHKWSLAAFANCECHTEVQTVDQVFFQCPIHRLPHGLHGLTVLDDKTTDWLLDLVWPCSGLKKLAEMMMMMKQLVLAFYRQSHLRQRCCAVVYMCWINY